MEPALFQFFMGMIGGYALGFALVQTRMIISIAAVFLRTLNPRRVMTIPIPVEELAKTQVSGPIPVSTILATTQTSAQPLALTFTPARASEPSSGTVLCHVCPACGLQAPEALMLEHFLGSPLHDSPSSRNELSSVPVKLESPVEEESVGNSLRDMLQTLNVMERLLKRDFYRHELRVRSGIGGRVSNIGGWIP